MPGVRTAVLSFLQARLGSLTRPLHDEQALLRAEVHTLVRELTARYGDIEKQMDSLTESVLVSRWLSTPDYLASRLEVGHWLNFIGLAGEGVEVGVYRGEYSNVLLRTWKGARLTSIDAWREFPAAEYVDSCNLPQSQHDSNHEHTTRLLARFGERSRILRETSEEAATRFDDDSLDFVYLDAQHHYEAVRNDISLWIPKVRPGGVIGGHDYLDGSLPSGEYGVKRAVSELSTSRGTPVIETREPDWPSWFIRID